jgi:hypothetical protein
MGAQDCEWEGARRRKDKCEHSFKIKQDQTPPGSPKWIVISWGHRTFIILVTLLNHLHYYPRGRRIDEDVALLHERERRVHVEMLIRVSEQK